MRTYVAQNINLIYARGFYPAAPVFRCALPTAIFNGFYENSRASYTLIGAELTDSNGAKVVLGREDLYRIQLTMTMTDAQGVARTSRITVADSLPDELGYKKLDFKYFLKLQQQATEITIDAIDFVEIADMARAVDVEAEAEVAVSLWS